MTPGFIDLPRFPTPDAARDHLRGWLASHPEIRVDHARTELRTLTVRGPSCDYRTAFAYRVAIRTDPTERP